MTSGFRSDMSTGIFTNIDGQWVPVEIPTVNSGGTWTTVNAGYVNVGGVWQQFFPSMGVQTFVKSGTTQFKVPPGIYSIQVNMVGGGGGGGGAMEIGIGEAGGGGGAGGYFLNQTMTVVPGEILTVTVGGGGFGAPYVGHSVTTPDGATGGSSSISGSLQQLVASGGTGGNGGNGSNGTQEITTVGTT